ncbi:hypothetical protein CASFOL_038412 [Castilleja foliolosa]|uniref:Uncharacterized protein n=1 Tax=Castilleja foliolosa TaxID=1961234 RepID=A0ABD3BLT5_9LAMI
MAMMEFEEGELGDLEFGEKSAEIGECLAVYSHSDEEGGNNNSGELINNTLLNDEDGGSSDNGESINTILLNDEDTLMTTADSNKEGNSVCSSRSVVTILDPTTTVTKRRKARHKSFLEKGKKRKSTGSSNPSNVVYQSKEFESIGF